MKKIFLLGILSWSYYFAYSQSLTTAPAAIDFGTVTETTPDSVWISIKNPTSQTINITGTYVLGDEYDNAVFSIVPAISFPYPLAPSDSIGGWIKLSPVHNIVNNGELLILNDGKRGPIRVDIKGQGHFSNSYYDSTENLSEEALKTALKTRLALGYTALGYTPARDAMFMTIDNEKFNGQGATVNTLECVYTGVTVTNYTSRTDAQNQGFNTEHTFPQSFFSSNDPMVSDLFHLFPTENNVNNTRGNSPFGDIVGTGGQVGGGSQYLGGIFEPRDYHKGRCARAMMYFALRYQDYSCFFQPQEATLVGWHNQFPPSVIEQGRNASIFALQHDRNPFIDYPQFAQRLHKITSCATSTYTKSEYYQPENAIDFGSSMQLTTLPQNYLFSVVNKGNLPFQITHISLFNGTSFALINNTDVDTSVQAHETHQFAVSLQNVPMSGGMIYDTLYYTLTPPLPFTPTSLAIPIHCEVISSIEDALQVPYQLFPNPTNDKLTLSITDKAELSLWNVLGQEEAISVDSHQGQYNIDTKNIKEGVYFLHIQVQDKGTFAKIVVQH